LGQTLHPSGGGGIASFAVSNILLTALHLWSLLWAKTHTVFRKDDEQRYPV
jgi:hypothetical protein